MATSKAAVRLGRAVRIDDLVRLEATQETHVLYCRKCHGTYSADHADYQFYLSRRPFKCCGVNNWLLRK